MNTYFLNFLESKCSIGSGAPSQSWASKFMRNKNDTLNNDDCVTKIDPNMFNNNILSLHFTTAGQCEKTTDVLELCAQTESNHNARLYALYCPVISYGDANSVEQYFFPFLQNRLFRSPA